LNHSMQKIPLTQDLTQYQFPPSPGKHYGFNIYALHADQNVLLIDTAYPRHAEAVRRDLEAEGRSVGYVVISHFHEDHYSGLTIFPEATILGSKDFATSQTLHPPEEGIANITPGILLDQDATLPFGPFELVFQKAPGHSDCSLNTVIDGRFIHVGDNLILSNDGEPVLPYAHAEDVPKHIQSLLDLRKSSNKILLPGHGSCLEGDTRIKADIDDRLCYLNNVSGSEEPLTYTRATAGCVGNFLHEEWHEILYPPGPSNPC